MPWESRQVVLSSIQRNELKRIAADPDANSHQRCRALIVLLMAEGLKNKDIAERLNVHENTVVKWRRRWCIDGDHHSVDDLGESTGRPRSVLTQDKLDDIKQLTRYAPLDGQRWTVRLLANEIDLPIATTHRALKELNIDLMLQSMMYED